MSSVQNRDILLKEYLIKEDIVRPNALDAAERECAITGDTIGSVLVKNGFLNQDILIQALLELDDQAVVDEEIVIPHIPAEMLIEYKIMFTAQTVKKVYVACLCRQSLAEELLRDYFPKQELTFVPANPDKIFSYSEKLSTIHDSDASVMEQIIRKGISMGASDIHIGPRRESYSVMYRYLGVRRIDHEGDMEEFMMLASRIKDRSRMDLAERRVPQDGGFSIEYNGRLVDMRVATVPTNDGEVIVIRILDPAKSQHKMDDLGITRLEQWRKGVQNSHGICLVCGPTGSGKTTTLNASIRELDRFEKAIFSAEDPVEYRIPYVAQVNINHAVGLDFSRAVRAFMRSDPDIILVGEIRDPETARNAIKAAETGHLVLGTLHTGSIHGAVNRLRDLEIDPHELKSVVRSVLAQRLMRVRCPTCMDLPKEEQSKCKKCFGSGYHARTIVSECHYFESINEVMGLLTSDDVHWPTMVEDAYGKYINGDTDYKEFERVFGPEATRLCESKGYREGDEPFTVGEVSE
ncbi:GspE/PulE family protein [Neptuniibacter sp. QD37_11]|uniref:GspE/PulE family protein n=1 Tax=Neptuniibacter sp. QD37_11 TaxID=3398209 RepID=UPI0039F45C49